MSISVFAWNTCDARYEKKNPSYDEASDDEPAVSVLSFKEGTLSKKKRDEWIEEINHFLTRVNTLSAQFVQITTHKNGSILDQRTGSLKWLRPAHIHFVYEGVPPLEVLSDGENIRQKDEDGESMSMAIDATPARLLLKKTVDLKNEAVILDVIETPTHVTVILASEDDMNGPSLMLGFRRFPFCLMQWTTVEEKRMTDLILHEPELNVTMKKDAFRFKR